METSDKDYIGAKLLAVIERLNGYAHAHQIATDAHFVQLSQIMESGVASLRKDNEIRRAKTEAYLQNMVSEMTQSPSEISKSHGEIIRWIAAIFTANAVFTISVTTLLVCQSATTNSATIVIYAQPAATAAKPHASAVSNPPPTPTAHAGRMLPANSTSVAQSVTPAAARPANGRAGPINSG